MESGELLMEIMECYIKAKEKEILVLIIKSFREILKENEIKA